MSLTELCSHCGCYHTGHCPLIKAIDYYPDGITVKRCLCLALAAAVATSGMVL